MISTKRVPIGQDDFEKVIKKNYYFVDKTLLIKEIIERHDLVNLITRPCRFGKTLNMSMVRHFFEISSKEKRPLFNGLKIAEEKALCENYMGKYPVISLTFMNAKHDTFSGALGAMQEAIAGEFRRHADAVEAYPYSRDRIKAILNAKDEAVAKYNEAIGFLAEILYSYYNLPVIILIDEYDVPLEASYTGSYYPEMLDFMRSLLRSALKSNPTLEFAVLTGCLRLAKESVFTGLNNFSVFSLMDRKFAPFFGFSPEEVHEMLAYFKLTDKQDEMREWFDGYTVSGLEIYNPWSVVKQVSEYLEGTGQPLSHWANTSGNEIVKVLVEQGDLSTKAELENLLSGQTIEKRIVEELTYDEIYTDTENLWTFLFFTGYLTVEEITVKEGMRYGKLRIPNKEIRYIFENQIIQWFRSSVLTERSQIYQAMLNKDAKKLQQILNTLLFNSISYMDYSESYYHGMMVGLFAHPDYIMKSNRETGLGRADITIQNIKTVIVIELKVAEHKKDLEDLCRKGIAQINENRYGDEFSQEEVIKVAISFYKKTCAVLIV